MSKPVTTFMIMPPQELSDAIKASKERLEAHLAVEFTGYEFKVIEPNEAFDGLEFIVLPLMNYIDDNGDSRLCDKPDSYLLEEIYTVCRGFNHSIKQAVVH
ncbi:hypothetical protein ACI0FM_14720 [Paenochrobactrum sp. BZR 588]|uniref:hypothetical protein n=1 Tax=Paenochrobactrum TaxID=999488 RepID=UPI0035BBD24A